MKENKREGFQSLGQLELGKRRKILQKGVSKSNQPGQREIGSVFSGSQVEQIFQDRGSNQRNPLL